MFVQATDLCADSVYCCMYPLYKYSFLHNYSLCMLSSHISGPSILDIEPSLETVHSTCSYMHCPIGLVLCTCIRFFATYIVSSSHWSFVHTAYSHWIGPLHIHCVPLDWSSKGTHTVYICPTHCIHMATNNTMFIPTCVRLYIPMHSSFPRHIPCSTHRYLCLSN